MSNLLDKQKLLEWLKTREDMSSKLIPPQTEEDDYSDVAEGMECTFIEVQEAINLGRFDINAPKDGKVLFYDVVVLTNIWNIMVEEAIQILEEYTKPRKQKNNDKPIDEFEIMFDEEEVMNERRKEK